MDLQLNGKTALVTGGSAGLGRAIAFGLAAEGVKICIAARRQETLEDAAQDMFRVSGRRPETLVADMLKEGDSWLLARRATNILGRIDILVNCAGTGRRVAVDTPESTWNEVMMINFTSRRQLIQAVLPAMIDRRWGRIINVTGGTEPTSINAGFSGKAALQAWSKGVSREVGRYGITINSIAPGRLLSEQVLRGSTQAEREQFSTMEIPVGRYGEPSELASIAVFLASPLASYVTGTVVPVDGGLRLFSF